MRIALIGASGQLGTALQHTLTGEVIPIGHDRLEVTDATSVETVLSPLAADVVINCSAYNQVDKAEAEPERAYAVNGLGPRNLARHCAASSSTLVHVSTDYVFGGAARAESWCEEDVPFPTSAYALSKLAGEYFVRSECPRHFVIRTCGLYGRAASAGKGNFVETMLRLGRERGAVSVVDDQWCTPTSAADLAGWIARLIETEQFGLYHATNAGATTWRKFAEEIFRQAGLTVAVTPISTAAFGAKARRPAYSVLDMSSLAATIGASPRRWEEALAEYLQQRGMTPRG